MNAILFNKNKFCIGAFLSNELIPGKNFTSYFWPLKAKIKCTITVHK